jgi:leucyl aminopeptidase
MPVSITIAPANPASFSGSLLAIPLAENPALGDLLANLDGSLGGAIQRSLDSRFFRGARDEIFHLSGTSNGAARVMLVGLGKITDRPGSLRRAAAIAARNAGKLGGGDLGFLVDQATDGDVEAVTVGLIAGSWEYKDLKTPPPENELRQPVTKATILADARDGQSALTRGEAIGAGHSLARTLAMMPGNLCTPEFLAKTAGDIACGVTR